MVTKLNLIVIIVNISIFALLSIYLFNFNEVLSSLTLSKLGFVCVIFIYSLHNLMNFVHQASHNLISKNRFLNNCIGFLCAFLSLLSFTEFRISHLLHHRHTLDPLKDPDFELTNNVPLVLMPFFILKKDIYFVKNKLYKNKSKLVIYLIERIAQICFISLLIFFGKFFYLGFFLASLLVVGYLNSFFLFYFPHYKLKIEDKFNKDLLIFKLLLFPISLSRQYHTLHHKHIKKLSIYYPLENFIAVKLFKLIKKT